MLLQIRGWKNYIFKEDDVRSQILPDFVAFDDVHA